MIASAAALARHPREPALHVEGGDRRIARQQHPVPGDAAAVVARGCAGQQASPRCEFTRAPEITGAGSGEGISLTLIALFPARRNVLSRLRSGKQRSMRLSGVTQKSTTFAGRSSRKFTRLSVMAVRPSPKWATSPCTLYDLRARQRGRNQREHREEKRVARRSH
jgi:hypothetical protein